MMNKPSISPLAPHFSAALVAQAVHAAASSTVTPPPSAAAEAAVERRAVAPGVLRAVRRAAARSRAAVAVRGRQQNKRRLVELSTVAFVASILLGVALPNVLNPPPALSPALAGDGGAAASAFLWFMASMTAGSSVVMCMLYINHSMLLEAEDPRLIDIPIGAVNQGYGAILHSLVPSLPPRLFFAFDLPVWLLLCATAWRPHGRDMPLTFLIASIAWFGLATCCSIFFLTPGVFGACSGIMAFLALNFFAVLPQGLAWTRLYKKERLRAQDAEASEVLQRFAAETAATSAAEKRLGVGGGGGSGGGGGRGEDGGGGGGGGDDGDNKGEGEGEDDEDEDKDEDEDEDEDEDGEYGAAALGLKGSTPVDLRRICGIVKERVGRNKCPRESGSGPKAESPSAAAAEEADVVAPSARGGRPAPLSRASSERLENDLPAPLSRAASERGAGAGACAIAVGVAGAVAVVGAVAALPQQLTLRSSVDPTAAAVGQSAT
jgi:hypothetical protein